MDATVFSTQQASLERARIVAEARALLLERGIQAVELADVALALRLPVAAVERQFPEGKLTLVQASLEGHLVATHQTLAEQREACGNAVEELLAMRRLLHQLISDTRSLFMREVEVCYPALGQRLRHLRASFTLDYLRANLQRGMREGLYYPDLAVDEQAHAWLHQVDALLLAANNSPELIEAYYAHFGQFLASITTAAGAYVVRRLQEAPPYY